MAKNSATITVNRKAYHDYHIQETVEAGIALKGSEIKSIRAGRVSLREAYARPENDELWLYSTHIASYDPAGRNTHDPIRPRKLLLHRQQINDLAAKVMQKGLTIVPLRLYIKEGIAKVELGVARGKRVFDKRETMARRHADREMERAMKYKRR